DLKDIFIYLLHHHMLNLTKRNKVLCLGKSHFNQELWKDNPTGICIEYDTNLFRDNLIKFSDNKKYDLIGNPVCYVDKLIKYPIRLTSSDRKSTRLNSSHVKISYAVFCLKKKKKTDRITV